jgi:PHD/YefM family antitoxin component YafN of YafNO toxin-antitoxin module
MYIKASAAIRNNYNEISMLCKETGEPVYLTKNGEGDLVVMDIEAFTRREKTLSLGEKLLSIRQSRLDGNKGHTLEEFEDRITKTIEAARLKSEK